jgi:hypothetical protein
VLGAGEIAGGVDTSGERCMLSVAAVAGDDGVTGSGDVTLADGVSELRCTVSGVVAELVDGAEMLGDADSVVRCTAGLAGASLAAGAVRGAGASGVRWMRSPSAGDSGVFALAVGVSGSAERCTTGASLVAGAGASSP